MLSRPISLYARRFVMPAVLHTHTKTCPSTRKKELEVKTTCPSLGSAKAAGSGGGVTLKRAMYSGPVRFGFIPDEWFKFFYNKTGVTGPYLFLLNLTNYLVSKEIYVMEHEYYLGLSAFVVIVFVAKNYGKDLGVSLDKQVDAYAADLEKGRNIEIDYFNNVIKTATDAKVRAEGQKLLMDAKKENVAMQLEAIYRERAMMVYRAVRGRMEYQIKLYETEARIQQKWMLGWTLENVRKAITPEFLQQALQSAIRDLVEVANRAK